METRAPYPETDAAEQDAVNTFRQLIDTKRVKEDIRTRDKYPNSDGTVELVDEQLLSLGKFEVQIRKIPKGATQYSCPASLVDYSTVSILPVVLVCADVDGGRAFWKAISPTMPEIKENQKTFTVRFDPASDGIDARGIYIQRWLEIVEEYRRRIAQYPVLRQEVADKLTVDSVSVRDKVFFQRYIGRINQLLDGDFVAVKEIMFPDVWKLGVGICGAGPDAVSYQIYKIPYGSTAPDLCALAGNPFDFGTPGEFTCSRHWSRRSHMGDPTESGERYVLDFVKGVVQERGFTTHGQLAATDILFSFLDQHAHCLGLQRGLEDYLLTAVNRGMAEHLLGICVRVAQDLADTRGGGPVALDFDMLSQIVMRDAVKPVPHAERRGGFVLFSQSVSLKAVSESIRYLAANEVVTIRRPFRSRSQPPTPTDCYIWSGFTKEDEQYNIMKILRSSVEEYSRFVKGNKLRFPESVYLDNGTSIIFVYSRSRETGWRRRPALHQYVVPGALGRLPKVVAFFGDGDAPQVERRESPIIRIDGGEYPFNSESVSSADFLFRRTPVLNMIYRLLCDDLEQHYEMGLIPEHCGF